MATVAPAKRLPRNAYTPLATGESYRPAVPAAERIPELTARSIGWGVFLCVVFTIASAYSGLKVGQVMEAAIPIRSSRSASPACMPAAPVSWKT